MKTISEKLLDEQKEIDGNIGRLTMFIERGATNNLQYNVLLESQLEAMKEYSGILSQRLEILSKSNVQLAKS